MQETQRVLSLNCCVVLRKPLITKANPKQKLEFARKLKVRTLGKKIRSCDLVSPDAPCQRFGRALDDVLHSFSILSIIQAARPLCEASAKNSSNHDRNIKC